MFGTKVDGRAAQLDRSWKTLLSRRLVLVLSESSPSRSYSPDTLSGGGTIQSPSTLLVKPFRRSPGWIISSLPSSRSSRALSVGCLLGRARYMTEVVGVPRPNGCFSTVGSLLNTAIQPGIQRYRTDTLGSKSAAFIVAGRSGPPSGIS
jgi:hypothetical protein